MAVPYRYTQELHHRFVQAVAAGASIKNAAEHVGLARESGYRWFNRGKDTLARWEAAEYDETQRADDPDWTYAQFALDVMEARGRFFTMGAAIITDAAFGRAAEYDAAGNLTRAEVVPDWKAALAIMERRDPEDWGRTHRNPYGNRGDDRDSDEMDTLAEEGEALVLELVRREQSA